MSQHQVQHYLAVREDWLAARQEEILDPAQVIIDPHHHLWDRPGWRYRCCCGARRGVGFADCH